jgi:hypothetical protein
MRKNWRVDGWISHTCAMQVLRSLRSTRQVKVIAAAPGASPALMGAFYGGVVASYVLTEKLSAGIRGSYDNWNMVPAAMVAGIGIGAKGAPPVP